MKPCTKDFLYMGCLVCVHHYFAHRVCLVCMTFTNYRIFSCDNNIYVTCYQSHINDIYEKYAVSSVIPEALSSKNFSNLLGCR